MAPKGKKGLVPKNDESVSNEVDDDMDVPDDVHKGFLESIKQIHGKPKITPATRNEPAAEVTEFHFHSKRKSESGQNTFREKDLLRAIKKKQPKVVQKLENVKNTKTLPKPLESVHEKKAQREVGFGNVKTHLNRWNDVVLSNRVADQISFPLRGKQIEIYDCSDTDIFSSFETPTPLEAQFREILNSSEVSKDDTKQMEQSKFRLTLKEMTEKRKMLAKAKAQASYQVAKSKRQNKIKSKKYHRILRREKTKQQLKNFETLQKTDPEAALQQLEQMEKNRAEERATLRHRNTGKWAHNQMVKAKYNKESRAALSEQLSKNRELTHKNHAVNSDSDSSDSDVEGAAQYMNADPSNPWIAESNEYAQFVTNYKKFWEEKRVESQNEGAASDEHVAKSPTNVPENSSELMNVENDLANDTCEPSTSKEEITPGKIDEKKGKQKNKNKKVKKIEPKQKIKTAAIINSSGSWSVTDLTDSAPADALEESAQDTNIADMFSSLEDKLDRKLKRKWEEVQKEDVEKKVDNEKEKPLPKNKRKSQIPVANSAGISKEVASEGEHSNINADKQQKKTQDINKKPDPAPQCSVSENIDPNKYLKVTSKRLVTEVPDVMNAGDEGLDDEETDDSHQYRITIGEAFAEDDVVAEFEEEKKKAEEGDLPKTVDTSLPGWGSWTDASTINATNENETQKAQRPRVNKRLLFKLPRAPPRKDSNRGHVIINEEKSDKLKEHMVSELPHQFTQVKDFEANIRAPIGRTWLPETAHQQLIAPSVVTKLGTVIEPIDEGELIKRIEP